MPINSSPSEQVMTGSNTISKSDPNTANITLMDAYAQANLMREVATSLHNKLEHIIDHVDGARPALATSGQVSMEEQDCPDGLLHKIIDSNRDTTAQLDELHEKVDYLATLVGMS
ncbi:hypothetical protein NVP1261O_17 [Vibrio phage 1.261.O._10N.286.51.A7]|uniref:Uncharacterized protein n=1 Tax=Vibrio phage 1.261.O._10N.286.51.A7 TaxID=1881237 RepID=A0A2I7RZJ8_9CAUD|nr:hypothetical protein HOU80_gp17 [Vibrio phage 1.261.O._10N.286.51.A7]AUR99021.1 hypothetical protein NVP1261O_17 [Vibrio phage 1.261.O._10N.286.51.A7]